MFVSVSVTPLRLDSGRARVVEEFDGRCPLVRTTALSLKDSHEVTPLESK
jgi:hypothetical protein